MPFLYERQTHTSQYVIFLKTQNSQNESRPISQRSNAVDASDTCQGGLEVFDEKDERLG